MTVQLHGALCGPALSIQGGATIDDEERIGLELVRGLSADQQRKAIVYDTTIADGLPPGRHQGTDGMSFGVHLIKKNRWVKDCIAGKHPA